MEWLWMPVDDGERGFLSTNGELRIHPENSLYYIYKNYIGIEWSAHFSDAHPRGEDY